MNKDRLINIIQDHANIVQTIDQIASAIENDLDMPNFIPVLHDTIVTDLLSKICNRLQEVRENKL